LTGRLWPVIHEAASAHAPRTLRRPGRESDLAAEVKQVMVNHCVFSLL
jgi:hypothetical protein